MRKAKHSITTKNLNWMVVRLEFVDKAIYLGVMLKVDGNFGVDLQYMKSKFYCSFNGAFRSVAWFQNELVALLLQLFVKLTCCTKPNVLIAVTTSHSCTVLNTLGFELFQSFPHYLFWR